LNLGVVLRDAGRYVEAHDTLRRAVEMMPDDAQAHANLGTSFQVLARFDEARACYEKAVDLDPELGEAHFGRATLRLREGDFAGGFEEFEWRWKCSTFRDRGFPQPRWEGQPLEGRTILLYAEQGLGDAINFVRFAADAKQRGGRVIVECQPPLTTILATCRAVDQTTPIGSPQPAFDVHAPLLSLPGILKLTEDQFWRGPYLAADPKLVDVWRQRLEKHAGFRIGLCWHGNPEHQCDSQRSIALANFAPLAAVPGTKFFSLQKEADAYEMISAGFEVIDLRPEFDQEAAPFLNAAAIIKALDLVVTCDTAIAHLAGALGAPVWTAISAHSDWRWLLEREDSPWYPSMRLFRQSQLDLWDDVFERIAQALAERVAAAG